MLLPAGATECAAPKEAVGAMSMSRVIAYGDELNLAYPARPKDPKIAWEPQWKLKLRLKSVASLAPGMGMAMQAALVEQDAGAEGKAGAAAAAAPASAAESVKGAVTEAVTRGVVDALSRKLFGR